MRREHGLDHGDVVHLLGQVRHDFRNPRARLAVLREFERTPQQAARAFRGREVRRYLIEIGLSVMLVERGLGIEQVHLTRPAMHEQLDDRCRLGLEMGRSRFQVVGAARALQSCAVQILAEQARQRCAIQPVRDTIKESATRDQCGAGFSLRRVFSPPCRGIHTSLPSGTEVPRR